MSNSDKYYIITGGSRGIGKQVAYSMAEAGYNIVLIARNEETLKEVCADIKSKYSVDVLYKVCDLSKTETIEKVFDECVEMVPNNFIHGIIYSSGQTSITPLKVLDADIVKNIFSINIFGFIELSRCYSMQNFNNKENCNIVVISSTSVKHKRPGMIAYAASKSAVETTMQIISKELAKSKIRVNAIRPALVGTDMANETAELKAVVSSKYNNQDQLLGLISPMDIANGVLYLISDSGRMITGTTLEINGGLIL